MVSRWFFCADSVLSIDCCCSEACVTGDQGVFAGRCAKHTKIRNIRSKDMWLVEVSYRSLRSLRTSGFFLSLQRQARVKFHRACHWNNYDDTYDTSLRWLKQTKTFAHYMKGSIMAGQAQNPLMRNIWYTSEMH